MEKPTDTAPKRGRRAGNQPSGRAMLISAAMLAFARQGFDGASLRGIAAEAGVHMALTARLFGTKAALWEAVIDDLVVRQQVHRLRILALLNDSVLDASEVLRRLIHIVADISWNLPQLPAFFMQESAQLGERYTILMETVVRPFITLCLPLIERAMDAGVVPRLNPRLFLQMLLAAISTPMLSPATRDGLPDDGLRESLIEHAIAMFIRSKADRFT
jgi:AcrR family transcriptional regulator